MPFIKLKEVAPTKHTKGAAVHFLFSKYYQCALQLSESMEEEKFVENNFFLFWGGGIFQNFYIIAYRGSAQIIAAFYGGYSQLIMILFVAAWISLAIVHSTWEQNFPIFIGLIYHKYVFPLRDALQAGC